MRLFRKKKKVRKRKTIKQRYLKYFPLFSFLSGGTTTLVCVAGERHPRLASRSLTPFIGSRASLQRSRERTAFRAHLFGLVFFFLLFSLHRCSAEANMPFGRLQSRICVCVRFMRADSSAHFPAVRPRSRCCVALRERADCRVSETSGRPPVQILTDTRRIQA